MIYVIYIVLFCGVFPAIIWIMIEYLIRRIADYMDYNVPSLFMYIMFLLTNIIYQLFFGILRRNELKNETPDSRKRNLILIQEEINEQLSTEIDEEIRSVLNEKLKRASYLLYLENIIDNEELLSKEYYNENNEYKSDLEYFINYTGIEINEPKGKK
jgi:hypothetical protein